LHELGFNVALNTDNRLMSNTTLTREYEVMSQAHNWDLKVAETMNQRARKAAFHQG
jgi:adenosine deaminase